MTTARINRILEKAMPFFIPASVIVGILLSDYIIGFEFLVPWLFAVMTLVGSLNSNFVSLKHAVTHPLPLVLILVILHIVMPVFAWGIGHIIFAGDIYTITGLILGMAIPTGITSFVWVTMYRGNSALVLAIILICTLLSPVIVPATMSFFVGGNIEIDAVSIMKGLLWMIVLPSVIGMVINQVSKEKAVKLSKQLAPVSKIFMGVVVALNGAVVAPYLVDVSWKLIGIGVIVLFIAFLGYVIAFLAARWFKFDQENTITMIFTGGMRNISTGVVIATAYFPAPVAIPVVLAMLFQQVLASVFGAFIDKFYGKEVILSTEKYSG